MKAKVYQLLERCVNDGVQSGAHRYNKHLDTPIEIPEGLADTITDSIMLELSEWFTFSDDELGIL